MSQSHKNKLRTIMNRAWKMFKSPFNGLTFGECLSLAWQKVKSVVKRDFTETLSMAELI